MMGGQNANLPLRRPAFGYVSVQIRRDPGATDIRATASMSGRRMTEREVNQFVNSSKNEGPQCLAPPEETQREPELELS